MKRRLTHGFISIELILGIMVIIGLMSLGLSFLEQSATTRNDRVAANQALLVGDATAKWAKDNYAAVLAAASPSATYASSVLSTYLPQGYVSTNIYGQGYSIRALKTAANSLEFMLVTTGGETIPIRSLRRIAGQLAPTGGFISSVDPTTAQGAGGGWSVPLSSYGGSPGGGHLAVGLFFKDGEMSVPDFLYRNAVSGHPEYNRMNTAIDMGANNINNAATVNATSVVASGNVTAASVTASGNVTATGNVTAGESYAQGWFRSLGDSGWYNQKWDGGLYMSDATWIRAYNNKSIYTAGEVRAGTLRSTGYLQIDGIATAGAGCSQQGQEARDATGAPLYCQSGSWKAAGGSGTWTDAWIWIGSSGTIDTNWWIPGAKQVQITGYGAIGYNCCGGTAAAYIDGRPVTQLGYFDVNGGSERVDGMWGNKTVAPGAHSISGSGFYISGYVM